MKVSFKGARGALVLVGLALALLVTACGGGEAAEETRVPGDVLKADPSTFSRHGVYWNPDEPGTGFFFESQGGLAVASFYLYEANGRPVWYSSVGSLVDGGTASLQQTGDTVSLAVNPAVAAIVADRAFTFSTGVSSFGTTASTTITLTVSASTGSGTGTTARFKISSGANTASGTLDSNPCVFRVTDSTFPTGVLSAGRTVTVTPCSLKLYTEKQLANEVPEDHGAALLLASAESARTMVTTSIAKSGDLTLNGAAVGKVPLTSLPVTGPQYEFSGQLQRFTGGQPAGSARPSTPTSSVVGTVTIAFAGDLAAVKLPGRTFAAEKYFKTNTVTQPTGPGPRHPEPGIYWNPAESGRGFTIDSRDGVLSVTAFHYADDGQPTWNLVTLRPGANGSAAAMTGDFTAFAGGQTLGGAWKAPASSQSQGTFSLSFTSECKGKLGFPGMQPVDVQRFAFGSLAAGKECRTPQDIPFTPSPPIAATSYFTDVVLTPETKLSSGSVLLVGSTLPNTFSFAAAGNFAALNGRTIYVVVIDPHGLYTTATPRVALRQSPPGASVTLGFKDFKQVGNYQGELQFYACLDPNCATQFVGSPFKFPYTYWVR